MAIAVPVPQTPLSVAGWGKPITDEVNRLTPLVDPVGAQIAALPKGRIGHAFVAFPDQSDVGGTVVDLTSFVVTFTSTVTRTYCFSFQLATLQYTSVSQQTIYFSFPGNTQAHASIIGNVAVGIVWTHSGIWVQQLAAGTHTIKLRGSCAPGTMQIRSNSNKNGFLLVEDIGP